MTREESLEQEVADAGPEAVALYCQIRGSGETAEWAAMCALRQPPGARYTARAYEQGFWDNMGCMSDMTRNLMVKVAKRAGVNTDGKFYNGTGSYTEQSSWSTCAEDVLTVAKKKNLTLTGALKHQGYTPDAAPKKVALAPDIVERFATQECQRDPALAERVKKSHKARGELREKIIEKHGRRGK